MDNRYFILKTDHKNPTFINVTFTGKVLRWKLYLQNKDFDLYHVPGKEEHQFVPDALSRLCMNNIPPPPTLVEQSVVALVPMMILPLEVSERLKKVHNSKMGHWGLVLGKKLVTTSCRRCKQYIRVDGIVRDIRIVLHQLVLVA